MDSLTTQTTPVQPGTIVGEVELNDLPSGALLVAQRHRSNPYGTWTQIGSPSERKNKDYHVVVQIPDGTWWRVSFHSAKGRTDGAKDKTPRKTDGYVGNRNKSKAETKNRG